MLGKFSAARFPLIVTFRIQHLQWLGTGLIAVICLMLGGASVVANIGEHERYRRGSEQLTRFMAVLAAANAISAERGPANGRMGAADREAEALAGALAASRRITDHCIDAMEAAFRREIDGSETAQGSLAAIRASLATGRRAVGAVAAMAPSQRSGGQVADAIEAMFAAADRAQGLRDELGRAIVRLTPDVAAEIILSTAASLLREHAGRLGSYVVMMLTSPTTDHHRLMDRFSETRARLSELRALLASYGGAVFPGTAIDRALAELESRYFGGALLYAEAVADAPEASRNLSAADFTATYVPGMRPVEELRELIAETARQGMVEARDAAFRHVVVSASLTILAVLVLLALAAIFRNALFLPLITARRQIIAIAKGDLSKPVRMRQISSEIREMFDGLDVLRTQQRHRQAVERERLQMAEQLRRLSETDTLTGLLNRRALGEVARRVFEDADARGQSVSVVMLDIDGFKAINDTRGHAVGDIALKGVAGRLQPLLRPTDIFARYGGEEFLLLLQDTDRGQAAVIAERLRRRLAQAPVSPDPPLFITASFGVASRGPGAALAWDELVAAADRRLYRAKQSGRDRVCAEDGALTAWNAREDDQPIGAAATRPEEP